MSAAAATALYAYEHCSHQGIGMPGCPTCDPDRRRVAARAELVARREASELIAQANARTELLKRMLEQVLASATPNPDDHPSMWRAWRRAEALLEELKRESPPRTF